MNNSSFSYLKRFLSLLYLLNTIHSKKAWILSPYSHSFICLLIKSVYSLTIYSFVNLIHSINRRVLLVFNLWLISLIETWQKLETRSSHSPTNTHFVLFLVLPNHSPSLLFRYFSSFAISFRFSLILSPSLSLINVFLSYHYVPLPFFH